MAVMNARPQTGKLICEGCGCTDEAACPGGCHWVSFKPPVCSACVDRGELPNAGGSGGVLDQLFAVGAEEGGLFGEERCPASEAPARHVPIFTSETEWHCVRCQQGFLG
jgi:hypothetical protein